MNAELKNFYIIWPNGELYVCDTLTGKNNIRGYIFENNKATYMVDCRYDIFNDKRTEKCLACKILPIYMSGCMRNRIYSNAQRYWTWDLLESVGLKKRMEETRDRLDMEITNSENIFLGGEHRRLCLAVFLASNASTLLFDEPTASLDKNNAEATSPF